MSRPEVLRPGEAWRIIVGDCREVLRGLPDASVDACVTDPPYELAFMGRRWDASGIAFDVDVWSEVLRVLKPGGHMLSFGGTRTYHRMTCAIEDAGFEVRDSIHWVYGSGFPKSKNIEGGRGTALKPAHEPIVVARKPLIGTVAANVAQHGTGAINVDGCRVAAIGRPLIESKNEQSVSAFGDGLNGSRHAGTTDTGRWPPNLLLTHSADCMRVGERKVKATAAQGPNGGLGTLGRMNDDGCVHDCPVALMDQQSGEVGGTGGPVTSEMSGMGYGGGAGSARARRRDTGGASRFFPTFEWKSEPFLYEPKAARAERDLGGVRNTHPTVKPIALMRWLVRLVTPSGGLVLDPFSGSGSTIVAALREGARGLGVELSEEYARIAKTRIQADAPLLNVGGLG